MQAERRAFTADIADIPRERLVYVDESGVAPGQRLGYGYARRGERACEAAPLRPRGRLNVIGAIGLGLDHGDDSGGDSGGDDSGGDSGGDDSGGDSGDSGGGVGGVVMRSYPVNVCSAVFEHFVETALAPLLRPGMIVVWDNARIHSRRAVEAVEARGARVRAQPRYSPDMNAIEMAWSKVKRSVRRARADTPTALGEAIEAAVASVSLSDIGAWVRHVTHPQPT